MLGVTGLAWNLAAGVSDEELTALLGSYETRIQRASPLVPLSQAQEG